MPITPTPTPTPDPIRPYNQEEVMPADDLDQTTLLETEEYLIQQVINGLLSILIPLSTTSYSLIGWRSRCLPSYPP